jgi:hypothetical protein
MKRSTDSTPRRGRPKGQRDVSPLRAFEFMRLLLQGHIEATVVPELPERRRQELEARRTRRPATEAARLAIEAGLAPATHRESWAGDPEGALHDRAGKLAEQYRCWIGDPLEQERERALVAYRYGSNGFAADAFDGYRIGPAVAETEASRADQWALFVPTGMHETVRQEVGDVLLDMAVRCVGFEAFFRAWAAFGQLGHLARHRTVRDFVCCRS